MNPMDLGCWRGRGQDVSALGRRYRQQARIISDAGRAEVAIRSESQVTPVRKGSAVLLKQVCLTPCG